MTAYGHFRVRRWAVLIGREWAFSCPPVGSFSCPPTGVTAAEVVASGDRTRLDLADLPGTSRLIAGIEGLSEFEDALIVVADEAIPPSIEQAGDIDIRDLGDAPIGVGVQNLSDRILKGIFAEGALAAWRQRLSDAADGLEPLTHADAEIIGRLAIQGSPLITELRAERRRGAIAPAHGARLSDDTETIADDVVTDLRAAVRFGAAGLAGATDSLLADAIELACKLDGWVTRLRLLLAAEEVAAIELLAACSGEILGAVNGPEVLDQILARYWVERRHAEELSSLLDDVARRLPDDPKNFATRILRRKAIEDVQTVRRTVTAYSSVVHSPTPSTASAASWAATTVSLLELDQSPAPNGSGPDGESDQQPKHSIDEAAGLLGELFAKQLPAARAIVEVIKTQHPDVGVEKHVQNAKRRAIEKLTTAGAATDGLRESIPEIVAELAMTIALLRGLEPRTEADFNKLGSRLLARADRVAKLQYRAGKALPMADVGLNLAAQLLQRLLAEYAFNGSSDLAGAEPGSGWRSP